MTDPMAERRPDPATAVWRRLELPTVLALIGLAILLRLGFWQVDRLAWKEALIRQVEQMVHDLTERCISALQKDSPCSR